MKYFYGSLTTHYDGLDWRHHFVAVAESLLEVEKRANATDFTHDNGIETQEPCEDIQEVTQEDFKVLDRFLVEI